MNIRSIRKLRACICAYRKICIVYMYMCTTYLLIYLSYLLFYANKKCKTLWCCSNCVPTIALPQRCSHFSIPGVLLMPTTASLIGLMCQFSRRSNDESKRAFGRLYLIHGLGSLVSTNSRVLEVKKGSNNCTKGAKQRGSNI